ncbi:MAG: GNAT family N-acetyltransferase [Anaeromyxobacter sp.]|nr:GNAT family N-acetyltransferase [Anaeromyxobacter sp.]MBL0276133.1 GNAT family N-acetyltransferase [Anaeromyxobacter sp.]
MGQLGRLVELGAADLHALQALFERCAAFFQLVQGAPPRPDQAERWLHQENVPGRAPGDKVVFGLLDDEERLVGAVDVTADHPLVGEYWLGTMILEPTLRGVGMGAGFHAAVLAWVRGRGAQGVQLCVQQENAGALRFWAREGYQETGLACQQAGGREQVVVKMRRAL